MKDLTLSFERDATESTIEMSATFDTIEEALAFNEKLVALCKGQIDLHRTVKEPPHD